MLDQATRSAAQAPRGLMASLGTAEAISIATRFEAVRVLNSLCGACAECPRGAAAEREVVMADLPPEPPAQ